MRFRVLFVSFALASFFMLTPVDLRGQKESLGQSLSVRQQSEQELLNLVRNLTRAKTQEEKFKYLSRAEMDLSNLRKRSPRQLESDELFLDSIALSFQQVFSRETAAMGCESKRSRLVANFEPRASTEFQNPALRWSLRILNLICEKAK